jgi:hypothetical protein
MRRKYKFESRQEAEEAFEKEHKELGLYQLALHDQMVKKDTHWITDTKTRIKIGLSRVAGATGGIVVLVDKNRASVHYLDDWLQSISKLTPPHSTFKDHVNEWNGLQNLASQAQTYRREKLDELHGPQTAKVLTEVHHESSH